MTHSNRRPLVAGAVAACAVVATGLLSACGSGQIAQTAQIAPAVPGVNGQATDQAVDIRDATVVYREPKGYPAGASAPLSLWIVNSSHQPVRLVGVTAAQQAGGQQVAAQVVLSQGSAPASSSPCVPPVSASPSPSPSPSASPSLSASATVKPTASTTAKPSGAVSASASPSPTASPSPSLPGATTIDVTIPVGACVELSPRADQYLQAVNLPQPLANQGSLMVMFQFVTADGQRFAIGAPPTNSGPLGLPVGVPASPGTRASITGAG